MRPTASSFQLVNSHIHLLTQTVLLQDLRLATQLAAAGSTHCEARIESDLAKMTEYMEQAQAFANRQAQYTWLVVA